MIDAYGFGRMTVNGREYTSDLIIHPDGRVEDSWWRLNGHRLVEQDIASLLAEGPEAVVVGTGSSGMMRVSPELADILAERGIELIAEPTRHARETFNRLSGSRRVAGCFHLTC